MVTRPTEIGRDVIVTDRLRLEPWSDAHFDHFARFMCDPTAIRFIRAGPLDRSSARDQHEQSLAEWDALGFGKRAIIEAETARWLGFVELSPVGPGKGLRDEDVEIGYFVVPDRWAEGIATEAASASRDEAFRSCGLDELIGRCRVENVASARILAKLGFRFLRLFEIDTGIVVEIHRLQREDWTVDSGRRSRIGLVADKQARKEYRVTG